MPLFAELHVAYAWEPVFEGSLRHGLMRQSQSEADDYVREERHRHAALLDALIVRKNRLWSDAMESVGVQRHLLKGAARREIPALAESLQADCIVMGTVARTGISGFIMGNTAETILGQVNCSVLAVKPPGFRSPVML